MTVFHADHALLPGGVTADVRLHVVDGVIRSVDQGASQPGDIRIAGLVLPGMANVHSHAFQRAMAPLPSSRRGAIILLLIMAITTTPVVIRIVVLIAVTSSS